MNRITINGILKKTDRMHNEKHIYALDVERRSGTVDSLLVLSPDGSLPEGPVHIEGRLHAEYIHGTGVPPAIIPDAVEPGDADGHSNAEVEGILKAKPICRKTKKGLAITNVLVLTDDGPIPVLLWGGNATKAAACFDAGDRVRAAGRLQSREYPDRQRNIHTTYELSARGLETV